jgi:tetraacyldisaccharide 4'-kinase
LLFRSAVVFRNKLFDWKILKAQEYPVPVICVGNITVGGTGKTPMIEYLIRMLPLHCSIAVVSRGYKRKTKGFLLATEQSTVDEIGDEPFQLYRKFPEITVAVDENRCEAIEKLLQMPCKPDVILLDDAYQHRYVKAGYSLLLVDYNRLPQDDAMLPAGNLRESPSGQKRADIVVITKCPADISQTDISAIKQKLKILPRQSVFFTGIRYGKLSPLFNMHQKSLELSQLNVATTVLLVTGIASPNALVQQIEKQGCTVIHLRHADHHWYSKADIESVAKKYHAILSPEKIVVTTEKDAMKLLFVNISDETVKNKMFYLPLEICFLNNTQNDFKQLIKNYVNENSRNSLIS